MQQQLLMVGAAAFAAASILLGCGQAPVKPDAETAPASAPVLIAESPPRLEIHANERVMFEFRGAELSAQAREFLDKVAAVLLQRPAATAVIEGHTDNQGGIRINRALSELRALVVMKALVDRGVARNRLKAIGYGFERPIAGNDTEEERRMNRRCEIVIDEGIPDRIGATALTSAIAPSADGNNRERRQKLDQ